jgi:hypothetical protein
VRGAFLPLAQRERGPGGEDWREKENGKTPFSLSPFSFNRYLCCAVLCCAKIVKNPLRRKDFHRFLSKRFAQTFSV